jgi:hypothetical protein
MHRPQKATTAAGKIPERGTAPGETGLRTRDSKPGGLATPRWPLEPQARSLPVLKIA